MTLRERLPHGRRWWSGFLDCVREVNANDEYLFQVDEMIVFGNYLDDSVDRPSEVDVVVELSRRHPEEEFRDRSEARMSAAPDKRTALLHDLRSGHLAEA